MKINKVGSEEVIYVYLSRERTPIAFKEKLDELMEQGAFDTEKEAVEWIENTPFELEIYYEKDKGLFAVEPGALESCDVWSPYTKEPMEEADN